MAKKYDVVVVGGGPAGLMAAKTAAEDGLKVVLLERKKSITEIHRPCGQTFFLAKKHVGATESGVYCYRDPVTLEIGPDKNRFIYPQGFSVDYKGPLVPYYHFIHFSPSGYQIDRYPIKNEDPWGFFYQRDIFLGGLLSGVEKAGADILTDTYGLAAENTADGVKVLVRGRSGEQTLEAKNAIVANGNNSSIVEKLGLNKNRPLIASPMKMFAYEMEGLDHVPRHAWLDFFIPSINPQTDVWMYTVAEGRMMVGTGPVSDPLSPKTIVGKFMQFPTYAPWFRNASIVRETACANFIRDAIREPVAGNVVIVGDAAAPYETLIQGAVACGYLAVKAIEKELNGQEGYSEYIEWWQNAFEFNDPTFFKTTARYMFMNKLCSDEEVDYLYCLFQGKVGVPQVMVAKNLELIRDGRPELYERFKKAGVDQLALEMSDVWGKG